MGKERKSPKRQGTTYLIVTGKKPAELYLPPDSLKGADSNRVSTAILGLIAVTLAFAIVSRVYEFMP